MAAGRSPSCILSLTLPAALWLLIGATGCSLPQDPEFENLRNSIQSGEYDGFEIRDIVQEADGGVVRVNVTLTPWPSDASEVERGTRNALSAIQPAVGPDVRLAVWSYRTDALTPEGMAFYSALTRQVHFKPYSELR